MAKVGRKAIPVTDDLCERAEALAKRGLNMKQIAYSLGMCPQSLFKKKREYKKLEEAIQRGKAKGILKIANKLYSRASEGEVTSMIFFLKNRDPENWCDVQRRELTGKDGKELNSGVLAVPQPITNWDEVAREQQATLKQDDGPE